MRHSASWMSIWDDRILEWIREHDSGSPKEIDDSGMVHVSKSQISRRLKRLAEHGLLKHLGRGVYVITDEGEAYLNEEYDAEAGAYIDNDIEESNATGTEVNGA